MPPQVVLADLVSPRERGRYSGYLGAVFGVGTTPITWSRGVGPARKIEQVSGSGGNSWAWTTCTPAGWSFPRSPQSCRRSSSASYSRSSTAR